MPFWRLDGHVKDGREDAASCGESFSCVVRDGVGLDGLDKSHRKKLLRITDFPHPRVGPSWALIPDMGGNTMHRNALRPLDLESVFARNKAIFGDFRMEVEGEQGAGGSDAESSQAQQESQQSDKGYPVDTPLEQMTAEQQANYWKAQSRKHEQRAKTFGNLTAEDLATLRDKATKHDALEAELMSDRDKAIAEARETAEREAKSGLLPKLVNAEFRAAAAGKVAADKLAAALEFTDTAKFVKDGEVDAEKVAKFIESIAPAQQTAKKGPSSFGLGSRQQSGSGPGDQGRAQAEKRFGTKTSA